jgi:putative photosynthetic complex assembly protein
MAMAAAISPRLPLSGALALAALAVVSVGAARLSGLEPATLHFEEQAAQTRLLRFEDRADGSVGVIDAKTGQDVAIARPGTNGFLRGALRGLMRERKRAGILEAEPFKLQRFATGQVVMTDLSTGQVVALNAFGPTNAAVFAAFLSTPKGGRK